MNIKKQIPFILLLVLLVTSGCKSTKVIGDNGAVNSRLTAKQLIKQSDKAATNFKTLVGKLKLDYLKNQKTEGTTVSFRMEKDKTIWMSKLGIVKVLITQDRVAFYNKFDKTFFDGDFTYLSSLLGTDLDFNKIQNLLLGQPLFNLNDDKYKISANDKSYILQPKAQRDLFELFLFVNPSHFKLNSQEIAQPKVQRIFHVDYLTYQKVDGKNFPERSKIIAIEGQKQLQINLELKGVKLDQSVRFPFTIPSGYKQIEL